MAEETATSQSPAATAQTPAEGLQELLGQTTVQVDDALRDDGSGYNDSLGSGSDYTSLNSSVMNYKYENGRRYHAFREGVYPVPNDEEEQDRMDLVHHIYRLILGGKLFLAPITDNPQRVLDLGTGTGIWAMDFADEYPSAQVIGTDLSPIQPKWLPPNCVFEVDDFEDEWLYHEPFDFIHGRELEGCIGDDNLLFQKALANLKPGGYLEMQAVYAAFMSDDDTAAQAKSAQQWMEIMIEGAAKFGKPWDVASTWKEKMEKAGFVDVQQEVRKLPIGTWPKDPKLREIGRAQSFQELQVVDSYTPGILKRVFNWTETEIQVFVAKVKRDLKDQAIHLYLPVYFIWGRKP